MCIALNADVLAGTAVAAADTGSVSTAAGSDITTGDGNVGSMVITLSIAICAAADTGTTTVAACQQLAPVGEHDARYCGPSPFISIAPDLASEVLTSMFTSCRVTLVV